MNILTDILYYFNELNINFDLYIIADTQLKTTQLNPTIKHADDSEFFSRKEFAEIASALFYVFGFARVFYSELEFLEYIFQNKPQAEECLIYNFSRDGVKEGKKSLIPAFCDLYGLRYTGSNAFTISLLRNKWFFSQILKHNGILVPQSMLVTKSSQNQLDTLYNHWVLVKNVFESASQGLSAENYFLLSDGYQEKLETILQKSENSQLLVQEYIDGKECEVLVLQYQHQYYALEPVEIVFNNNTMFLDSDTSNSYSYSFRPLEISLGNKVAHSIKEAAEKAAKILMIKDYARFDFRIKDDQPYLIDIAGTPYTIKHSSVAYLFEKIYHLSYQDIYKSIVSCCISNQLHD